MKSMFDIGFRPQFMPIPLRRPGLGQDEGWDSSEIYTSIDQMPDSTGWDSSGMYTSYDQGPPAESVTGMVTDLDLWKSPKSQDTDWGKILSTLAKTGAEGYAGYTKAQIVAAAAKQKAGLPAGLPNVNVPPPSSGLSPNTVFLVGGLAVVGLIAVLAAT